MFARSNEISYSKTLKKSSKFNQEFRTPTKYQVVKQNQVVIKSLTSPNKGEFLKTFLGFHQKTRSASIRKIKYDRITDKTGTTQICTPGTQDSDFFFDDDQIEVSFSSEESLTVLRKQVKNAMKLETSQNDSDGSLIFNSDLSVDNIKPRRQIKANKTSALISQILINSIVMLKFPI